MYEVVLRSDCDRACWDTAADTFTSAWAWHRSELLNARSHWLRTEDHSFCVRDRSRSDQIVAIVPLVVVRPRFLNTCVGGHFESTGGPALSSELPRRSLKKVQEIIQATIRSLAISLKVRRCDFSSAPLVPQLLSIDRPFPNPMCYFGVKDTSTQSWVLSIRERALEELWNGLEHRSRKQIKKAGRNGLTADIVVPNSNICDQYYDLHIRTCMRNSISPHPKAYFQSLFSEVADAGLCKSCVVCDHGNPLTIQNFLIYKNTALYWTVASHEDALKLCANDYGMWKSIQHFSEAGLEYLECGEAFPSAPNGKLKGLNDFKKSFGGELYPYYRGKIVYQPVLEGVLEILRQFRSGGAAT